MPQVLLIIGQTSPHLVKIFFKMTEYTCLSLQIMSLSMPSCTSMCVNRIEIKEDNFGRIMKNVGYHKFENNCRC
jgi:hypothetical protein